MYRYSLRCIMKKKGENMKKYEQIAHDLEEKIVHHVIGQSQKLPSLNRLAKQYSCSKATVIKAYDTLIQKHLVYVKAQSGYYVADGLLKTIDSVEGYFLDSGNPIVSKTSLIDAKHCMSIAIDQYSDFSLNVELEGSSSLRQILCKFLASQAIYASQQNIFLCQGMMQMLAFFTDWEFPNDGSTILIEEPTYSYYVDFLKRKSVPVLTISRNENGIDLKELERLFRDHSIKFFYVVPRNHNPLGTVLSSKTRQKIAELAVQYNVYIIEDDYFGSCSNTPRYLPIFYYQNGKNCIYLSSFSKIIPYIRIGTCVCDKTFQPTLEAIMNYSYYYSYQMPSLVSQATFEAYLRSSLFQKQSDQLKCSLRKSAAMIRKANATWDHSIAELIGGNSGFYCSIVFRCGIDLDLLIFQLSKQKIYVQRNERSFYHPEHGFPSLRLSMACILPDDLAVALKKIWETILDVMKKDRSAEIDPNKLIADK